MQRLSSKVLIIIIYIGLLWTKTNYVQSKVFHLEIENNAQNFILDFNPLSSILLLLGIGMLFKNWGIFISYFLGTFVLFANVLYYRELNDFITIPVLMQTSNAGDLKGSIASIFEWTDIFYWIDVIAMFILLIWFKKRESINWKKRQASVFIYGAIIVFLLNMGLAEKERPDLLSRTFDRQILVKNIGIYNFHIYDVFIQSRTNAQRAMADSSEITPVYNYIKAKNKNVNGDFTSIAQGKNVIIVSMESLQSFVIDRELNGQVITPFLNEFKKESIYFDNFYHQVGQGRTSDSEFLLENSLYPLDRGAVFFTHGQNQYYALPKVLKENGYFTSVQHANDSSFWNRDVVYPNFGYDKFFDKDSYTVTKDNSIGWGLKDKDFFAQSVSHMSEFPQPFYTKLITLTNHYPFVLDDEDKYIEAGNFPSQTLNRYFQTVRYMDDAFKEFIEELKASGLYDKSIIIAYGDHFGISENHNRSMGMLLGKKINDFESFQLQRTPMFIHIPGYTDNKVISKVSGQIDIRPTILNLLGIKEPNPITFGQDLLSAERPSFVVERDGSFSTSDVVYKNGVCYDKYTGNKTTTSACKDGIEKAKLDLTFSNQVIYGDLLRFLKDVPTYSSNKKEEKK
ncbi:LTA synthase family protein [Priestia megaterium]|uniref:Sulfatase-like hydrolase/transferase n=1 Tax=Priestia megaterium TaxID=1404 RepID=A0A6M6E5P7_PRIMG|nr:LTA synthase family protein [Priestia megaterium]QJX80866.1 sulfatase-like hydrolase/transferase [Priestia megaterium]